MAVMPPNKVRKCVPLIDVRHHSRINREKSRWNDHTRGMQLFRSLSHANSAENAWQAHYIATMHRGH
jgi:hypothetical protein